MKSELVGKTVKLKPDYGYFDTTHFPIGGNFHRVPANGLTVKVDREFTSFHGVNLEGKTSANKTVAFSNESIEGVSND